MFEINFDLDFYNLLLSQNDAVTYVPSVNRLIHEATKTFYDEYDYYPDIAACAPGKFNIMGEHVDYFGGTIAQGALPFMTVIVGKKNDSDKCRIITTSEEVDKPKKLIFPILHRKRLKKGFPSWGNVVKGIMNNFPKDMLFGFDAVIHSNVPWGRSLGAEMSVEVAFFTFLESGSGRANPEKSFRKALFCKRIKEKYSKNKLGSWDSFTPTLATNRSVIVTDCRKGRAEKFSTWDPNILFLLTYPQRELEISDKELIPVRKAEIMIAAKLIGLNQICCAEDYHLRMLENMETLTAEEIVKILRELDVDEDTGIQVMNEFGLDSSLFIGTERTETTDREYEETDEDEELNQPEELERMKSGEVGERVKSQELNTKMKSREESQELKVAGGGMESQVLSIGGAIKSRTEAGMEFQELEVANGMKSQVLDIKTGKESQVLSTGGGTKSREMGLKTGMQSQVLSVKSGVQSQVLNVGSGMKSRELSIGGGMKSREQVIPKGIKSQELGVEAGTKSQDLSERIKSREAPIESNFIPDQEQTEPPAPQDSSPIFPCVPIPFDRICDADIINCLGGIDDISSSDSEISINYILMKRLRHFITESRRSLALFDDVLTANYTELGFKIVHSHLSLKMDYEVCSPELDQLVQLAMEVDNVFGAKMISGGGTLTMLRRHLVDAVIMNMVNNFGKDLIFYLVFPSEGCRIIKLNTKNILKSELSDTYPRLDELLKEAVDYFDIIYNRVPTHGGYSPGVITLVGDHTDYNQGFALPMAVGLFTMVIGAVNGTAKIRVATTADVGHEKKRVIFQVPTLQPLEPGNVKWAQYVRGVISQFKEPIPGFDCLIHSSIPLDSGISSSAALEVAMFTFLEELTGYKFENPNLKSYLCMKAEHEFTKTLCGITDATAAISAKEGFAAFLDCRTAELTYVPFQDPSVAIVLICLEQRRWGSKSMLLTRLEECYDAARFLKLEDLRVAHEENIEDLKRSGLPEMTVRRAKHVITENSRAMKAVEALKENDYDKFGFIMVQSHISMRDDYEVSCPDLDYLVECAMEVDGVLGSRMTGNGYGASTVTLVKRWAVDDLIDYILYKYKGIRPKFYMLEPYDGAGPVNVKEYISTLPGPKYAFENVFPI